ncbi:hypothetical protein KY285_005417 [Solanum tuberosum]|nr:hypothetical protein KY284_005627 [Solanum tuberosum]KAH0752269.1 hypothetical protein KY285_005417 [Solanum tuberosum]
MGGASHKFRRRYLVGEGDSYWPEAVLNNMKVVALVSGGKDNCYAMMKCIQYGHEIVALANLIPADDATDELDSYLYQTERS